MDRLKRIEEQIKQSKAQVTDVRKRFEEGSIPPEEVFPQCMNALEKIGEAIREAQKQN